MRAILIKGQHGPSESLYIGDAEKPKPKTGEVVVKVVAFGLNRMDLIQRQSGYPLPPGITEILGVEFSGTVDELGHGVTDVDVGDEVLGLAYGGAYAEYVALDARNIIVKPKELSWVEGAAIMENWITAFQALVHTGEIKKGNDVLVHAGASGVTIAAMQLAHLYGASKIFTTVSSEEKINFVRSLRNGATHAINYKTQDFAEEIKKVTDGKGVAVIVDYIGRDYFARNIDSLAMEGHMIILAHLSGDKIPEGVSLSSILYKRLCIQGSTLRTRSAEYQAELIARFKREVFEHFTKPGANGLPPLEIAIHKVYPWQQIKEAHDEMEGNKNSGKIIIEIK